MIPEKVKAPVVGRQYQSLLNERLNDTAPAYALQAAGLDVDSIETGRLIRCKAAGGKRGDRAGWYFAFEDGGIVYGDWRTGEVSTWQPVGCRPPDREAIAQARRERELVQQAEWQANARKLGRTWAAARVPTDGGIIARYLASRGLPLPDGDALRGAVLPYWHDGQLLGSFPCMVATVTSPGGKVASLHRTFLKADGAGKADVPHTKKLMPAAGRLSGASVRLMRHGARLGIAEGIETALAASVVFGVPCWAAVSAHGLAGWLPPEGVATVDVFGDHDRNDVGQEAARTLAKRLARQGVQTRIHLPDQVGDWNDVLLREEVA